MKMEGLRLIATVLLVSLLTISVEGLARDSQVKDESLRRGERRATLDPSLFSDLRVRKAYQVARDIPWVLDSIYCYCKCEESPVFRHRSLLSCYVDNHASV